MFNLVVENEEALKRTKILITGFHGLGSVGYISSKHLVDELKAERVAIIRSRAAPPFIYLEDNITNNGNPQIVLPFEFYAHDEILIFLPRLPPYRHSEQDFAESLVQWILNQQFKLVVLLGGVDKSLKKNENEHVRYVPTRKFKEQINKQNEQNTLNIAANTLSTGLMIQGPLAIILGLLDLENKSAVGVLAFAERERPDPLGSANTIEVLNALLNLNCSTEELQKNAKLYEEELKGIPVPGSEEGGPPDTYT
ncbi:MAG: proteasome assembly chaperone family protein [Candidatus Hodarchaeales archaeon]